tara:strand:- start:170 stop:559 length:390 start_codon:yes stop_codon:yes gene_type:complete
MSQHFRKYGFPNASAWDTAKAEIEKTNDEGNTYWNPALVDVVYEIGYLCEQWGVDAEGNQICEVSSPLYSVDVVWHDAPLSSWESAIVWPLPVGVSSMGYSLDTEYAKAYCVANPSAEYCQPPVPPVEL